MDNQTIVVRGAREHNLRNVNLDLPRNKLICFTGVSGSGKSSLAFDTLYAEGQRRYVESLSSYARQFLGQLPKPDVDYLGGLSPSISIQQKTAGRNPRSTVGTITEIYDFLRVLFARIGQGHCPRCGRAITAQTREQIIARIQALPEGARFLILAPVIRGQKGEYKDLFADLLRRGFIRARVDGDVVKLTDDLKLDKRIKHHIEVVIDRLKNEPKVRPRLAEAVEQALTLGEGALIIAVEKEKDPEAQESSPQGYDDILLSAHYACTHCDLTYEPPTPQLFSFNSPQGMCPDCDGLGMSYTFDPDLLIPEPALSFYEGAIPLVGALRGMGRWRKHIYEGVAETLGIDLKIPWQDLPKAHRELLLQGAGDRHITFTWKQRGGGVWKHGSKWEGIVPQLLSSFKKTAAGPRRHQLEKYMRVLRCPGCNGQRLNPQARAVRVGGKSLIELCAMPVGELGAWFGLGAESSESKVQRSKSKKQPAANVERGTLNAELTPLQHAIAGELLKEIRGRVGFLLNVGLHYLTLDRAAPTLSGGEAQRIRLAGQIGCGLVGVLYILDEPSIGLHPRDNERLLNSLLRLRDVGNTVVVVEHDEETMRAADYIVDFGPGPGVRGGEIVAAGTYDQIAKHKDSLTGQYLTGRKQIAIPDKRRKPNGKAIQIVGARHHNLKNVDVTVPLGVFIGVTGVSGSGKSSLINDILLRGLRIADCGLRIENGDGESADDNGSEIRNPQSTIRNGQPVVGSLCDRIDGAENIDKVIAIDQSAIGRTPRSNPATYIKVFDEIRSLFTELPDSKVRGYKPGRFSFNVPGGRCEACEGNGSNRLEMDFLADVWVTCPVCDGQRFNRETLQVRFKGKSIHDVLNMDIQEALEHFTNVPKIRTMLQTLHDVGLDYLKLGQASPTLSGGEAQRIKLARELCKRGTGRTLYVLDEPTTGLHFDDVEKLLRVLHGFVDNGNTVVVIEHNLDVIKTADWLLDLGPEGGAGGGELVFAGTPEQIVRNKRSHTGAALAPVLKGEHVAAPRKGAAVKTPQRGVAKQSDPMTHLSIQGAQQHNLKNINVTLPREQMTVFCGPSGSGKSSLALDTIYAEGQRRYIESLSAYARQFLGQMEKPRVESVSGLSPAISIEQKTTSKSPRSTVGTVTEIYDYLRVLYARLGQPYCPQCNIPVGAQTVDEIIARVLALPEGTKLYIMAPIERRGQEKYEALWEDVRRAGFARIRIDGTSHGIEAPPAIDHRRKHKVEVVVDRIVVKSGQRGRLADTIETALELGRGVLHVAYVADGKPEPDWKVQRFSQHFACEQCGRSFEPLNPHHFSFNSPLGWCPTCEGLGVQKGASLSLVVRDGTRSLRQGALSAWPELTPDNPFTRFAEALARHAGFALETPFAALEPLQQKAVLYGTGDRWIALDETSVDQRTTERQDDGDDIPSADEPTPPAGLRFQYKGVFPAIDEAARVSPIYRGQLDHLVSDVPCSTCGGSRLRDDAAAVRFQDRTLGQMCAVAIDDTLALFQKLTLKKEQKQVAGELLREVVNRLQFLADVGLEYLTLNRPAPTLSGGESQRIRLASQIGSGLTGVLYVLDEPTIGLHPRDNSRLLKALNKLRDLGNTMILVEHDREVIANADYLLDFGPGAGDLGGEVTAQGTPAQIQRAKASLTGQYLSGKKAIAVPTKRRASSLRDASQKRALLSVKGARHNNLKHVDVDFPLGCFVAVTGVSGSGKSSLVHEVLHNTLARRLHRARTTAAAHDEIVGIENIDKVINVDQDPIGNSPSSNPATYTGVFDLVRQLFAQLPESKVRGYPAKRFSFNKPGGRCEACEGNGQKLIEMHFLPDVWVECDVCHGLRYNPETLNVRYKGKSIADVLRMRVREALELFGNIPKIRRILQTLADVGLDYLALGQPAPTLSGGEAQRVKLAAELGRPNTGKTLYLLDEPTTGLHFDDIHKLLEVLQRLVDLGNTVIVVEHNLDVIKTADWVIDMGPEAGAGGGRVVAAGTPEAVVSGQGPTVSHTGTALAPVLAAGPHADRPKYDPHAAEAERAGDVDLDAVGQDARMPWEADGQRWHTAERITLDGKACRWEGDILPWLDEQIHRLGAFAPTNWNQRTVVEINAQPKSLGWFLHAMTGQEWLLRLTFQVAKNSFKESALEDRLGIPALNDTPGLEIYGSGGRVSVSNRKGPWQMVSIQVHRRSEIDTPQFREFLKEAVGKFQNNLKRLQTKPEDVMPWKVNGERWHLGDKGFPPGRKVLWERALLTRLLQVVRQAVPDVQVEWESRDGIMLKLPGIGLSWGRWKTKDSVGLDCRFYGKKGQFNLSRVEPFGIHPEISADRDNLDVLRLVFQNEDHLHAAKLKPLLQEHAAGFREVLAK